MEKLEYEDVILLDDGNIENESNPSEAQSADVKEEKKDEGIDNVVVENSEVEEPKKPSFQSFESPKDFVGKIIDDLSLSINKNEIPDDVDALVWASKVIGGLKDKVSELSSMSKVSDDSNSKETNEKNDDPDVIAQVKNYLSSGKTFDDFVKDYKNEVSKYEKPIEQFKGMSPKEAVFAAYKAKGFSDDKAREYVNKHELTDTLDQQKDIFLDEMEISAEMAKKSLLKTMENEQLERAKIEEKQAAESLEKEKTAFTNALNGINNIEGFPIDNNIRNEAMRLATEVDSDGNTGLDKVFSDPKRLAFYTLLEVTKGKLFNYLKTKSKNDARKEFDKLLDDGLNFPTKSASQNQNGIDIKAADTY